ncbi:MAG: MauE/DoxX family redox-associated membrane protein [Terriglobia bacterium]
MAWRVFEWMARLSLGALFLYAGYAKLRNPFLFEMAVDGYQLLPPMGVIVVARGLPWLEVVLGLLLWTGWKLPYSAAFTSLLLGAFLTMMAITYARGIEAACGCFGTSEPISPRTLARDSLIFLAAAALTGRAWRHRLRKSEPAMSSEVSGQEIPIPKL